MIKGIEFDVKSLNDFEYNWNCTKYYTSIIDTVEARQFLINILENWENVNNDTKTIWLDLIVLKIIINLFNQVFVVPIINQKI